MVYLHVIHVDMDNIQMMCQWIWDIYIMWQESILGYLVTGQCPNSYCWNDDCNFVTETSKLCRTGRNLDCQCKSDLSETTSDYKPFIKFFSIDLDLFWQYWV